MQARVHVDIDYVRLGAWRWLRIQTRRLLRGQLYLEGVLIPAVGEADELDGRDVR